MQSYFKNRAQIVTVNGTNSEVMETITGIPQGTCLGPLLYIMYTNDIESHMKDSEIIMYADDTSIYKEEEKKK